MIDYNIVPQLYGAFAIFVAGIVGIFLLVYRVLHPRMSAQAPTDVDPYAGQATCKNCPQYIRGCRHQMGVPSTWVHSVSGRRECRNGRTFAEHP